MNSEALMRRRVVIVKVALVEKGPREGKGAGAQCNLVLLTDRPSVTPFLSVR